MQHSGKAKRYHITGETKWFIINELHNVINVFQCIIVKLLSSNLSCVNTISRAENRKGVRDISPTLLEGQNKNVTYFDLILCTDFNHV